MIQDKTDLFAEKPVPSAVLALAIPTIISQLITVIYNMADTFFVGQMGDPAKVAAVSVAMPAFILLTGIANLFGLGGASLISRRLGISDTESAKNIASFCIVCGVGIALVYGIFVAICRPFLLPLLGATADTYEYAYQYVLWTTTIGGVFTVSNALLAHLVRAEGAARPAGFGVALGGILNIILDPIFIFTFHLGLTGAAMATMLSNCIAVAYYAAYLMRHRTPTVVCFRLSKEMFLNRIAIEVCRSGLRGIVMAMMSVLSNATLTKLVSNYSTEAIAGIGIAKKIDTMAYCIAQGLTQGVLPLLGYNFAAGNLKRVQKTIRFTLMFGLALAFLMLAGMYLFAPQITRCFIDDAQTVMYGQRFLRIICFVCPTTCVSFLIITVYQAFGKKIQPLLLSFLRKGCLDVPLMFWLNSIIGVYGIAWATPIADWLCFLVSVILFFPTFRSIQRKIGAAV
jgi:putative MATE family efflux protein